MKILAIGAHPDDIEIFMYGLLTKFKQRGDKIFTIVAFDYYSEKDIYANQKQPLINWKGNIVFYKDFSLNFFIYYFSLYINLYY